jgi:hypothetical protein
LKEGNITYDENGVKQIASRLLNKFQDNDVVKEKYVPELSKWIAEAI